MHGNVFNIKCKIINGFFSRNLWSYAIFGILNLFNVYCLRNSYTNNNKKNVEISVFKIDFKIQIPIPINVQIASTVMLLCVQFYPLKRISNTLKPAPFQGIWGLKYTWVHFMKKKFCKKNHFVCFENMVIFKACNHFRIHRILYSYKYVLHFNIYVCILYI